MTEHATELRMTVGQVAARFGVTVRTLHHYDEIDLVAPSERTPAGYRVYTRDDLTRLQHVVVYRRLGLSLEDIASVLASPASLEEHLLRQRATVMSRLDELRGLVTAIDTALERVMTNQPATEVEMKEIFGSAYDESHQAEAEERWGDSDAWAQSTARTSRFTKADWEEVKAEAAAVNEAFAAAYDASAPADSPQAAAAAELHRASIERFYDCSYQMQCNLAAMYVADPRFTKTYEDVRTGMAQYVHDAIVANATAHGVTDQQECGF